MFDSEIDSIVVSCHLLGIVLWNSEPYLRNHSSAERCQSVMRREHVDPKSVFLMSILGSEK